MVLYVYAVDTLSTVFCFFFINTQKSISYEWLHKFYLIDLNWMSFKFFSWLITSGIHSISPSHDTKLLICVWVQDEEIYFLEKWKFKANFPYMFND